MPTKSSWEIEIWLKRLLRLSKIRFFWWHTFRDKRFDTAYSETCPQKHTASMAASPWVQIETSITHPWKHLDIYTYICMYVYLWCSQKNTLARAPLGRKGSEGMMMMTMMMALVMKKMKNRRNLLLWRPQRWPLSTTHSQPLSFSLRKGASATPSASDDNDHGHGKSQQNQGYHLLSLPLSLWRLYYFIISRDFNSRIRANTPASGKNGCNMFMAIECVMPKIKVTTFRFLSSISVIYSMAFLFLLFRLSSVRFK